MLKTVLDCRVKLGCDVLTMKVWWAQLQKHLGSVSNDKFKPLKFMYFMSDACTCKILEVSNSFATKSNGQRNDENINI